MQVKNHQSSENEVEDIISVEVEEEWKNFVELIFTVETNMDLSFDYFAEVLSNGLNINVVT